MSTERRRIYLASRFANAAIMREVRDTLHEHGHLVTSSWIDCPVTAEDDARRDVNPDPAERAAWGQQDISDLGRADTLVLVDPSGRRGGCYVEFGYAMALGHDVVVVGDRTNVFTYLARHCPTLADLPAVLAGTAS